MAVINIERLLQPVSADSPCGENLEYDTGYAELQTLIQGKPEQQFGKTIIPAEEPDWRDIQNRALELLERSKDMWLVLYLIRAALKTQGIVGMSAGVSLLRGLLENHWDALYPRLDPDDDNDPTMRANILAALCDRDTILRDVREAPLVSSRLLGRFSLKDVEIATGVLEPPVGSTEKPAELTAIDGAFMEVDLEELKATAKAVAGTLADINAIDAHFTAQVGAARAPDLTDIIRVLKEIQQILTERLSRRGVFETTPEAEATTGDDIAAGATSGGQPAQALRIGEIGSRDDVVRVLDKLCDYYAKYEPSSPVPLLLQRAKRLTSKNFIEILQDLAPDAVAKAEMIRGAESG